ncbi:MAG: DUF4349 domain-containing protein [Chloroflexi bacterium]|nr:DUF4349 domain-containing protein [Chloroflexota bacterium]
MNFPSLTQTCTQAGQSAIQFARRRQALLIALLLLSPLLVEAGRMAWAWWTVNEAARQAIRYAVTQEYDSAYCQSGCKSDSAEEVARLKSITAYAQSEMDTAWDRDQFPAALDVTVCSDHPGYAYDADFHTCLPRENPGQGGDEVLVSITYDYPLGAGWGAGVSALPIQATRRGIVEHFGVARSIDVPADLLMNETSLPSGGERLVVVTGDLGLIVPDVETSLEQVAALAKETGGYVLKSSADNADEWRSAEITIRVPADQFDALLGRVKALGSQVLRENIQGRDVTEEYIDLEGRLKGLQTTLAQLDQLTEKAQTVEEALQVSIERGKVQEQIEQALGRKQYLENQAALATLTVSLSTTPPPPERTPLAWRPSATVENASRFLVALGYFFGDLAIWALIVVLPLALVVWAVVWIVRRIRRKA